MRDGCIAFANDDERKAWRTCVEWLGSGKPGGMRATVVVILTRWFEDFTTLAERHTAQRAELRTLRDRIAALEVALENHRAARSANDFDHDLSS